MKTVSISTARRRLGAAQLDYANADRHARSLPTEGFNCHLALTPALEAFGRTRRAVIYARDMLDAARAAGNSRTP